MRRHATTLVLLVLGLGLALFLWFDREKVSTGEAKLREKNVLPAWRRDDLSRLEIAHEDETILLVRTGDRWEMRSPRQERVDGAAVDRLLGTLEYATRVRPADESPGPERARGTITMGDLVFHFVLGGPSPRPEGSSYFRLDGGPAFVVSKELTDALLARADTYRDRSVVPYLSTELRRLEARGHFTLDRLDDRSFTTGGLLVDRQALEKIWAAIAEIRAESFADDAVKIAAPRLVLGLVPTDGARPEAELVFGEACPGRPDDVVVVRTKPGHVAACVPRLALEVLTGLAPAALLDRHPFSFRHDEIEELRLAPVGAGRAIEVARRGTGFHLREPEDRELDTGEAEAMSELLLHLEQSVASAAPVRAPFAGAIATTKIRVAEREETVEVGALDLARREAKVHRLRDDAVLAVGLPVARRLLPRTTALHPLAIAPAKAPPTRVGLACGTPQELVDEGQGLRLVRPAGYATDGMVTQLVDAVGKGKALAWVADADDGTFGLDGGCTARIGDTTLVLGAEGESGTYGAIAGQPGVFVAPPSLRPLVSRIYVGRALLGPEPVTALVVDGHPVAPAEPAANVVADAVLALGAADVGRVDLTVAATQGGTTRTIRCGPVEERFRRCAVSDTKAVFSVYARAFDALLGVPDAGADASIDRGRPRP